MSVYFTKTLYIMLKCDVILMNNAKKKKQKKKKKKKKQKQKPENYCKYVYFVNQFAFIWYVLNDCSSYSNILQKLWKYTVEPRRVYDQVTLYL